MASMSMPKTIRSNKASSLAFWLIFVSAVKRIWRGGFDDFEPVTFDDNTFVGGHDRIKLIRTYSGSTSALSELAPGRDA